jgi:hypothetical protein
VFEYAVRATILTRGQAVRGKSYGPSSPSTRIPSSTHDSPSPSPSTVDASSSQQQREEETRLREQEVTRKEEDARRKAEAARQREKEKDMIRQAEGAKRQQEEFRRREEELKAKEHESKRKEAEILRWELELWEREEEIRRKEEAARRVEMAQIIKMAEERRREEQELGEREEEIRRREEAVQREVGADTNRKEREESLQSKESERQWKAEEEAERKKEEEAQRKQKDEDAGQGLTPSVRQPGARTIEDPIVLKSVDTKSLASSEFTYAKSISSTQTVTITYSNHHLRAYYRHKGQWDRLRTEKALSWDMFPWPVLKQPTKVEEIIADDVEEYLDSLYQLPQNLFGSMEEYVVDHINRWDYDRMDAKVFSRVHIQQRRKVEEGVIRVGAILLAILRSVQESR